MKQLINFAIVGSIGFIVDATFLFLFIKYLFWDMSFSRALSFLIAVFVTWLLNRSFTFIKSSYSKKKEYSYYLIIQILGAFLNYAIFIILIKSFVFFENYFILALAIASFFAMFFNFIVMKKKLFVKN